MRARVQASAVSAVLVLTISMIAFGGMPGAVATQGQPMNAGQVNTATNETVVQNTNVSVSGCTPASNFGVLGCGSVGVEGFGNTYGTYGHGDTGIRGAGASYGVYGAATGGTGVFGSGAPGVEGDAIGASNGVYGHADNSTASGVYGQNDGAGYGVAGRANAGTGVFGDSANATGVFGDSTNGTGVFGQGGENGVQATGGTFGVFATGTDYGVYSSAPNHGVFGQATASGGAGVDAAGTGGALALRVTGKATFSRSGVVTIAGGTASLNVALAGVNAKSMILATAQQSTSVSVKAAAPAVPSSNHFTIYLTGNAPAAGLKVAYFVLN